MLLLPAQVPAKSCAALKKDLVHLRSEYHKYVTTGKTDKSEGVKFERLVKILDEIIDLKRQMRESNCKVPLRQTEPKGKK